MVQKSPTVITLLSILYRIFLFIAVIVIAFYTSPFFLDILEKYLGYITPSGFLGFTLADWGVSIELATVFWAGTIFGTLGRKWDYLLIAFFFVFALVDYIGSESATVPMYIGLIATLLIGNAIGFVLKLARQKFLPKFLK